MVSSSNNPLEYLTRLIPGYSGHQQLEKRREDDRLTRAFLSRRLQESKDIIDKKQRTLVEANPLAPLVESERIRKAILRIQQRLDSAVEGYSSWFDKRVVDEALLKRVADADSDIVVYVDRLHQAVSRENLSTEEGLSAESLLLEIEQRLDRRNSILRGDA